MLGSVEEGIVLANKMKYPVILKATAGGKRNDNRNSDDEFQKVEDARMESAAAFGNMDYT